jgi:hypothetical protein
LQITVVHPVRRVAVLRVNPIFHSGHAVIVCRSAQGKNDEKASAITGGEGSWQLAVGSWQ